MTYSILEAQHFCARVGWGDNAIVHWLAVENHTGAMKFNTIISFTSHQFARTLKQNTKDGMVSTKGMYFF